MEHAIEDASPGSETVALLSAAAWVMAVLPTVTSLVVDFAADRTSAAEIVADTAAIGKLAAVAECAFEDMRPEGVIVDARSMENRHCLAGIASEVENEIGAVDGKTEAAVGSDTAAEEVARHAAAGSRTWAVALEGAAAWAAHIDQSCHHILGGTAAIPTVVFAESRRPGISSVDSDLESSHIGLATAGIRCSCLRAVDIQARLTPRTHYSIFIRTTSRVSCSSGATVLLRILSCSRAES